MATLSLEARRRLTLAATILGSSLAFIDTSVVIVALPTIERDLDLGLTGEQWIFLAYSLALAALYLVGGALGDRFGRRRVFFWGVIGFAAASVLAGAAPNGATLIAARVLQGIAGAFLTTNSLALLRAVYAENAGRAIGLWTSFTSVATILGPPAGGALVEWTSWRWIFFLNLPVAGLTLAAAAAGRCDERSLRREGQLDLPGAALSAAGFGALTYTLVEGADQGFSTVWWAAVLAAAALGAFVWVERRVAEPMLDFKLFRRRNFAAANLETFLVYGALYGQLVYLQLFLQFLGFSPFEASLFTIPASAIMIVLAARFGALADRHGPRLYLTAGPALIGCSLLLLQVVGSKVEFWYAGVPSLLMFAFGLAMLVAPITATALKSAPQEVAGIASGVNSTVSRLGSLLTVALIGLVISLVFESRVGDTGAVPLARGQADEALRNASIDAFHIGMLLAAGLAFAGAGVAALWISDREARGELSEQAPAPARS